MKVTGQAPPRSDPRAEPLPLAIDDAGLATWVQEARTVEEAWRVLGLPGGRRDVDPAAITALAASVTALCTISDAIGLGLKHFGELGPDTDPPAAWVDRMVELYGQELEGYWALDDLAYAGLEEGGWTVTTPEPPADDPVARIVARLRWQLEPVKPATAALWYDRALHELDDVTDPAQATDLARDLMRLATDRHFAAWRTTRRTA